MQLELGLDLVGLHQEKILGLVLEGPILIALGVHAHEQEEVVQEEHPQDGQVVQSFLAVATEVLALLLSACHRDTIKKL